MTEGAGLTRLADWRARLVAYLAAVARAPYRPGRHDCALFVAGAVEAMTGRALVPELHGYKTLKQGRARLADLGIADLSDLAARHFAEVKPILAHEGDIAILRDRRGREALGLVQGVYVYGVGRRGLELAPRAAIERAFRV